ncbi:MAG: M48 family metalloprotease [Thermoanaerobaculia bacterium]
MVMKRVLALTTSAVLLLVSSTGSLPAQTVANPDLFVKSAKAAQQALEYYGRYDNPEELERMAAIGYRLAQESKFQDFPFTFYLIDMPEPNAFALPGGQIFITKGMLDMGLNDDMLAGLLGHEIGHVVLSHGTRIQRRATLLNVLSQALLVGVMIGASQSNDTPAPGSVYDPYGRNSSTGDLIQGTAAAGVVITELLMRSYSRNFEDESDEEGQRLAATAGFDPDGTRQLMEKMRTHLPQAREYGYWRTHPFFEERVQAASAREKELKIQPSESAESYRTRTQATLLSFVGHEKVSPELAKVIKEEALVAWPKGPAADGIRLEQLHEQREVELAKKPLSRDLTELLQQYQKHFDQVSSLTPDSALLATLAEEMAEIGKVRQEIYPQAAEVLGGGIYQVDFLETFLSNYPDAPEAAEVSLALATAYSRLGRQSDAVARYLDVWERAADSETRERAQAGLRSLAPGLEQLAALEQLTTMSEDPDLQSLAAERLERLAPEYKDMANGADYLRRFPQGEHVETVNHRLNQLADKLYGELILYQSVGDHVKGLERIQKILTYAPQSPAAERLRDRIVLEG